MNTASTPTVERSAATTPTALRVAATIPARIQVAASFASIQRANVMTPTVLRVVSTQGPRGPAGPAGGGAALVLSELPSGLVDGANATFTTEYDFDPDQLTIRVNGLSQLRPVHFNTTGTRTIVFADSPQIGDLIQVDYLKG